MAVVASGASEGWVCPSRNVPQGPFAEPLSRLVSSCPRAAAYPGYRSDLVSVVANALFGRTAVQQEVQQVGGEPHTSVRVVSNPVSPRTCPLHACMQCGGVELLLSSCQLDDTAPLAREFALWGVRNLCASNPAAQVGVAA